METVGSKQVYDGPWLTVREDEVRRPDGSVGTYTVVDGADLALVIPLDGDRLHLVEQYRHPVCGRRWEFPSGSLEPGLDADAEALAARELREETGLVAGELTRLGRLDITPSTLSQRCTVFAATDLAQHPPEREPAEQDLRSAWFGRGEVAQMILDGTITDAKTTAAYALLMLSGTTR
jgi:8-oxo-dGDP phosphatase